MNFQDPFNYGDGKYQLFYLFRANLALTFLEMGISFWMIQQVVLKKKFRYVFRIHFGLETYWI